MLASHVGKGLKTSPSNGSHEFLQTVEVKIVLRRIYINVFDILLLLLFYNSFLFLSVFILRLLLYILKIFMDLPDDFPTATIAT